MARKIYFSESNLIKLKENMTNGSSVCHIGYCNKVNEAAPEIDEYEIGDEGNNPPLGGNYYHVSEGIDFDSHGMSINDKNILDRYNLNDLILSKNGKYVTLNKIIAKKIGNGYGGKFMEDLIKIADKNGWILSLTPDTSYGATSIGRLKKFYKKYGFVSNKGKHSDFNTRESMIRKPINENINESTFDEWYDGSILRDNDGNPIKMYHGTDSVFDAFSKEHIGRTGAYEGYGFNFTPYESRARGYNSTNVIEAYLKVKNPMTTKTNKITLRKLISIISELDKGKPYTDTIVAAYEPAKYNEKWDALYYRRALPDAAKTIYNYNKESNYGDAGIYAEICLNGNADKFKTIDVFEKLGFDSAIFYDNDDRINTVVVFEPNQIKKTTNKTFTADSDIMGENIQLKNNVISEDKRTDQARARSKNVIRNYFKNATWLDTVFQHQDNPNGMTYLDYMFYHFEEEFYHDPNLRKGATMRLEPLICKLAFESGFQQENPDARKLHRIGAILNLMYHMSQAGKLNLSKIDIENTTFEQLNDEFGSEIDRINAEEREVNNSTQYIRNSDYEVIGPVDYNTAHNFGNQSCPDSKLCYTQDEETWNQYTSDGFNNVYIILKNGWENIKPIHDNGSDSAYDTYGLSMIFVFVDQDGNIAYCNTRWNHNAVYGNGYSVDHAMGINDISNLIGARFDEVFKPNNKWNEVISTVMQRIANGEDFRNVFDYCGVFKEGLAVVGLNDKSNYINQEGQFLSNQWFDSCGVFREGFAVVGLNGEYNFINQEGKLLSDQWFDGCGLFYEGFAKVTLNGKYNFINQEGKLLSDQWFNDCSGFKEGYAMVKLNGKCNFINEEGKFLSDQWFDNCIDFNEGFAQIKLDGKWNYINKEGRIISKQWFDVCWNFMEGFGIVNLNGKLNFIDKEGNLLSNQWFDFCNGFNNGYARVKLDGKWTSIDKNGNISISEGKDSTKTVIISEEQVKRLKENFDFEVNSSDIDLSSFKKQDELVPNIWNNWDIDSRIRLKLLDIANDFWKFVNLTWVEPISVILTGSICNFNWSKYSDIDLHLIVNFDEIDEKTEFVKAYLDSKKNEWNNEHDSLEIMGHKVELYVQDIDEMPKSGGIYDLNKSRWIELPDGNDIKPIELNKFAIKEKAAKIMTIIDNMYHALSMTNDSYKLNEIGEDSSYLWQKIKKMRKDGLEKDGESSSANICYKIMRRMGYLDKLWKLRTLCYDKSNSINEGIGHNDDMLSIAIRHFGTTNDIRECGYILPNGYMLDFSGKHTLNKETDSSYLSGKRAIDHRDISDIGWSEDGNTKNFDISMEDFIGLGAIRTHVSKDYAAINLLRKPTTQQLQVLERIIRYSNGCVDVEIGDGNESLSYGEFENAKPSLITMQIKRYFDDGIKLMGNVNESINKFKKVIMLLKEETVADGSSNGNPYKDRWKAERDALKNFICNYGTLMQSKEDDKGGKLYKCFWDKEISNLIGYNYCLAVQWDQIQMKPKSIVYIRALDKFTPNIKQMQYDARGKDNVQGTSDDMNPNYGMY